MSQSSPTTGVLFSSANHKVVFLNKTLQTMLKYPEAAVSLFIGKPVHEILGMPEKQYQEVATQVIEQGQVDEIEVELEGHSGHKLTAIAEGVMNKDMDGSFTGIDYTFRQTHAVPTEVAHSANRVSGDIAHEVLRFYFKRQLEGFHQTLTNMGGKKLGSMLNTVVNTTAENQQWNVTMDGDKIIDDAESLTLDSYRGLLFKAASYVSKVLGDSMMAKQVEKVNKKTNPKTFDFIEADWHKQH